MPNSKHMRGENIIPFRLRGQKRTSLSQKHDLEQPVASRRTKPTAQAGPTPELNTEYVRLLLTKGNPTQELIDECAPSIVRRVLRHVRKRSRQSNHLPKSLPRVLSRQLQLLCDFDHSAGIVLREWLNGNLHALPDGFEETYARSSKNGETSHG